MLLPFGEGKTTRAIRCHGNAAYYWCISCEWVILFATVPSSERTSFPSSGAKPGCGGWGSLRQSENADFGFAREMGIVGGRVGNVGVTRVFCDRFVRSTH